MRKNKRTRAAADAAQDIHILVVEDEEGLRHIYEQILSEEYQVTSSANSQDAIRFIQSERQFEFLITDFLLDRAIDLFLEPKGIRKSDGDGLDVAMAFRNKYPDTPMIMSTNSSLKYFPRIGEFCELGNCRLVEKARFATPDLGTYMRIALKDIQSFELPSPEEENDHG